MASKKGFSSPRDDMDFLASSEPFQTAFQKQIAPAEKATKGRRRGGKFGGRAAAAFRASRLSRSNLRDTANPESGYLVDDSSPEKPSSFSPLAEVDWGTPSSSQEGGLFSALQPLTRPGSMMPRSLSRSTSTSLLPSPPPFGAKTHRRAFSMRGRGGLTRTNSLSLPPGPASEWEENQHPNKDLLDDIETYGKRERKKVRRRHSTLESVDSLETPSGSSGSFSVADPTLSWLPRSATPRKPLDFGEDGSLQLSPSQGSIASSSRKRNVCGSPVSDRDDLSLTGYLTSMSNSSLSGRKSRSRSRIFSLDEDLPMSSLPLAPVLTAPKEERHIGMSMDTDDDDNSCDSEQDASPNTSYESYTEMQVVSESTAEKAEAKQDGCVLSNMSSFEDLSFLVKALRKENRGKVAFGRGNFWTVAPPLVWPAKRRAGFFEWAKRYHGFTVRSAGMSVYFLQISQAKGVEILHKMEEALSEYKQREQNGAAEEAPVSKQSSAMPAADEQKIMISEAKPMSTEKLERPPRQPSTLLWRINAVHEDEANQLADELSSLTVKDAARSSTGSLIRTVTLLPAETTARDAPSRRPSMESLDGIAPSRPSVDSIVHANDLNLHLHGHSPMVNIGKPPKLSIGSLSSTGSFPQSGNTPLPIGSVPVQNFSFIGTPVISEDRGWGSRPVEGKDWGSSLRCEVSVLTELTARFEESCRLEGGPRDSFGPILPGCEMMENRSSNLAMDLEANEDAARESLVHDMEMSRVEEERWKKKRRNSFSKRKRVSLWVSATLGAAPKPKFRATVSLLPVQEGSGRRSSIASPGEPFVSRFPPVPAAVSDEMDAVKTENLAASIATNENIVTNVLSFMDQSELLQRTSCVNVSWAKMSAVAHANLLLSCVATDEDEGEDDSESLVPNPTSQALEWSWNKMHENFPWACFLAEGGAKQVYKVHNSAVGEEEVVSVMDTENLSSKQIVANELAVAALLSSLARRGVCPNFVKIHGVFSCSHPPSWGTEDDPHPLGKQYVKDDTYEPPEEPPDPCPGRYQYIRMEILNEGDAEEYIKRQKNQVLRDDVAQAAVFQTAFALHAAADRFSVKHYDVKLLNLFVQNLLPGGRKGEEVVLRYGFGSHVFALKMPAKQAIMMKLADFGTANTQVETNGQPVTIAQFTTLENTPPDFMILGDEATQGHGHDCWGLGLCMLHLFTGKAPYEEILEDVKCPANFKERLRKIWENERVGGYSVIRSVINEDVVKDDAGNILEGDPDEVFYHTLYRYLVLFGIPTEHFQQKKFPKVWKAIQDSFPTTGPARSKNGRPVRRKPGSDMTQYNRDRKKYSLQNGSNKSIARARNALRSMEGGMDLLFHLCAFDPTKRATAMQVLNSPFMENLREEGAAQYGANATVHSYMDFATHT